MKISQFTARTLLVSTFLIYGSIMIQAQNVGIGNPMPAQKLDVDGWIQLGNESHSGTPTEGTIRYHTVNKVLEYYDGGQWVETTEGEDGRTVLSGNTDPNDANDGEDGDFYINTTSYEIFGPKTGGMWGSGTSLVGPTGSDPDPTNELNTGMSLMGNTLSVTDAGGSVSVDLSGLEDSDWLRTDNSKPISINDNIYTNGNIGIGTTTLNERFSVVPNTDVSAEIGRAHIGSVGHTDWAGFSHVDGNTQTNYALIQNSNGLTLLNSASGQDIQIRNNNVNRAVFEEDGDFGVGTINPISRIHAEGDIYFNNNALISNSTSNDISTGTNVDHIWHDDGANSWHFVSDDTYQSTGNTTINVGEIIQNGNNANIRYVSKETNDGWRLVYRDDFQGGLDGWVSNTGINNTTAGVINRVDPGIVGTSFMITNCCGASGANHVFKKNYDMSGVSFSNVKIIVRFYYIDSWDADEYAYISLANTQNGNPTNIWSGRHDHDWQPNFTFMGGTWSDSLEASASRGSSFWLMIGTGGMQAPNDESFGIDEVEIWVR